MNWNPRRRSSTSCSSVLVAWCATEVISRSPLRGADQQSVQPSYRADQCGTFRVTGVADGDLTVRQDGQLDAVAELPAAAALAPVRGGQQGRRHSVADWDRHDAHLSTEVQLHVHRNVPQRSTLQLKVHVQLPRVQLAITKVLRLAHWGRSELRARLRQQLSGAVRRLRIHHQAVEGAAVDLDLVQPVEGERDPEVL